jgi:hypothetical protein
MIRITRFDSDKADDFISKLEEEMKKYSHNLEHLTDFALLILPLKRNKERPRTSNRVAILMISKRLKVLRQHRIVPVIVKVLVGLV